MTLHSADQSKKASKLIENLFSPVEELRRRIADLEAVEAIRYISLAENNVSNPPTLAQLTSIFGTPAAVGKGFTAYINDNGAGTNFYLIASDGTNWWIFSGTKAT
jgi:hypothetical protein